MKITRINHYGGSEGKVARLGLAPLFEELTAIMTGTAIHLLEVRHGNGAAHVRERVDERFRDTGGWKQCQSGGIDWTKERRVGEEFRTVIGVEVQVSARSDLLVRDLLHLRNSLQRGEIDIGVIVVPEDRMQRFLPDRTPSFSDAVRYMEVEFPEAMTYPIIIMAVEHDGPGSALPKKKRRS